MARDISQERLQGELVRARRLLEDLDVVRDGKHATPDQDLVDLAVRIYEAYMTICLATYGQYQRVTRRTAQSLYRAAELCRSLSAHPFAFVRHQLVEYSGVSVPWLRTLVSERIASSYAHDDRETKELLKYISMLRWVSLVAQWFDVRDVLLDESNDLTPLVRFSLAQSFGYTDIAEKYAAAACSEYRMSECVAGIFASPCDTLEQRNHGAVP